MSRDPVLMVEPTSDRSSMKVGRKDNRRAFCDSRLFTFLLEACSLVALLGLAFTLRFKDHYDVLMRGFRCSDESIRYSQAPLLGPNHTIWLLNDYTQELFFGIIVGIPLSIVSTVYDWNQLLNHVHKLPVRWWVWNLLWV